MVHNLRVNLPSLTQGAFSKLPCLSHWERVGVSRRWSRNPGRSEVALYPLAKRRRVREFATTDLPLFRPVQKGMLIAHYSPGSSTG